MKTPRDLSCEMATAYGDTCNGFEVHRPVCDALERAITTGRAQGLAVGVEVMLGGERIPAALTSLGITEDDYGEALEKTTVFATPVGRPTT